jgi:hypothetical protein
MQILSDKGRLDSFLSGSFSMKIFDQIAKIPESQNYIKQTMGRIFETMDLDYMETIDLEDAAENCKNFIDAKRAINENKTKSHFDEAFDYSPKDSEMSPLSERK